MDLIQDIFGIFFMLTWISVDVPVMKLTGLLGLAIMIFRLVLSIRRIWEESGFHRTDPPDWDLPIPPAPLLCPYCNRPVEKAHKFCSECGRRLPERNHFD